MAFWRRLVICTLTLSAALSAQRRVDPKNSYYRVIAVVPLVGSGTPADPIWPKHVPAGETAGQNTSGIIAFACELTDDGKHAIIELVGVNHAALEAVLADRSSGMLAFEKGKVPQQEIEVAVQPFRKGFSLSRFGVAVQ